ncbi:MAG: DUF2946 family protein [Elusimicrobiota bacterium]
MRNAEPRRPRALTRFLGILLASVLLSGQAALAIHNHGGHSAGSRTSVFQHDEAGDGVDCLVCSLTAHSQASAISAPVVAVAVATIEALPETAPAVSFRAPVLRPSSRAPPSA